MPELDLSLPEAPRQRGGTTALSAITCLASVAAVVLLVLLLQRRDHAGNDGSSVAPTSSRSGDHVRELARDLEKRTLYAAAANAWGEYIANATMTPQELAKASYRRGVCLQRSGDVEAAAALFTEIERLDATKTDRRDAQRHLLECLSSLGKEEARRYVLQEVTTGKAATSGLVVARIGGEPVTLAEVRAEFAEQVRAQMRMFAAGKSPEQLEAMVDASVEQRMSNADSLRALVQQSLASRVLYREALARKLDSSPEFSETIGRIRRQYLAQQVFESERNAALRAIGDTDLQNHYDSHTDDYVESESVDFSYLSLGSEDEATKVATTLRAGGEAADELAGTLTKGATPARAGESLAGIGPTTRGVASLLVLEEGAVAAQPIEVSGKWYVLRCDKKNPSRKISFAEVKERVRTDLLAAKEREMATKLQERLAKKFQVEIVLEEIEKTAADATKKAAARTGDGESQDSGKDAAN